jgi:hypothetical protein
MSEHDTPTFDEALRLTLAYYCILEPEKRAIVMAMVEKYADRSRTMEASADKVVSLPGNDPRQSFAVAKSTPNQATRLIRQKGYLDHLRDKNFSIIENAIEQMFR